VKCPIFECDTSICVRYLIMHDYTSKVLFSISYCSFWFFLILEHNLFRHIINFQDNLRLAWYQQCKKYEKAFVKFRKCFRYASWEHFQKNRSKLKNSKFTERIISLRITGTFIWMHWKVLAMQSRWSIGKPFRYMLFSHEDVHSMILSCQILFECQ